MIDSIFQFRLGTYQTFKTRIIHIFRRARVINDRITLHDILSLPWIDNKINNTFLNDITFLKILQLMRQSTILLDFSTIGCYQIFLSYFIFITLHPEISIHAWLFCVLKANIYSLLFVSLTSLFCSCKIKMSYSTPNFRTVLCLLYQIYFCKSLTNIY